MPLFSICKCKSTPKIKKSRGFDFKNLLANQMEFTFSFKAIIYIYNTYLQNFKYM